MSDRPNMTPTILRWLLESSEWSDAHPIQTALGIILAGIVLGWVMFVIDIWRSAHGQ